MFYSSILPVRNMKQMANILYRILAVMDCNIDVANQGILKIAKQIDDTGSRTMGVLTKPDLVQEVSKQEAVMQVLLGNAHKLKLGYYAIKNRGADDTTSTPSSRAKDEESFFREPAWARAKDRCGTMVLKKKLQQLLFKITKQGLPAVKADISKLLDESRKKLGDMGQPRGSATAQRQYLGILANQFQNVTQRALNAEYSRENLFRDHPDLKLITRVFKLQTEFAETFRLRGHSDNFDESDHLVATEDSHDQLSDGDSDGDEALKYPELQKILLEQGYKCPEPKNTGSIMNRVYEVYESSRGPDLGTVSETFNILPLRCQTTNNFSNSSEEQFCLLFSKNSQRSGHLSLFAMSVKSFLWSTTSSIAYSSIFSWTTRFAISSGRTFFGGNSRFATIKR